MNRPLGAVRVAQGPAAPSRAAQPGQTPTATGSGPAGRRASLLAGPSILLEVAAALLVPAGLYSFVRVFSGGGAIVPIIGTALLSTALAALLRRMKVPLPLAALVSLGFLTALVVNRFAPGTGRLGFIPTGATKAQLDKLIHDLGQDFKELRTPVPAYDPFLAASMMGAWVMAFLTDWGAMRLRLAFEPVLPAGLLFVFAAVMGARTDQVATTLVFGLAIGLWAVVQRTTNLIEGNAWLAHDRRRGSLGVARLAAAFALVAVLFGALVGPYLPGASSEEIVSLRDRGDPTRVVVSPYVSIESRLVNQANTQLFTVTSSEQSYWRLAGLDTYEDNIWKVAGNFSPENGDLSGQPNLIGQRQDITQDYAIQQLDAIWLPAAFAPTRIQDPTVPVTWNAETSSLTVANNVPNGDGASYTVVSKVPKLTADELRGAPNTIPADIAGRYLKLPNNVPEVARTQAHSVTDGAATRYDKMLALQDYFRTFDYSVKLSPRQGDPIAQFLRERIGFCQQFAGTFAVMARSLGIPARVAIGFTWGDPIGTSPDGRTVYAVSGRQTHAWPEVWFEGLGWVAFEPTPGRGEPSTSSYTGVAAQQDSAVQPEPDPATDNTTPPDPTAGTPAAPTEDPDIPLDTGVSSGPVSTGPSTATIVRVLVVLAVLGAYLGGIPLVHQLRRQRRRKAVAGPANSVETAWAEAMETLDLNYGISRRPAETRRELALRLRSDPRVPPSAMAVLADKATVARYFPQGLGADDAAAADTAAHEIEKAVGERVSLYTRWKRLVSPRRLWRNARRARTRRTASPQPVSPTSSGPPPSLNVIDNGNGDGSVGPAPQPPELAGRR